LAFLKMIYYFFKILFSSLILSYLQGVV
jgi:hypothetical protein